MIEHRRCLVVATLALVACGEILGIEDRSPFSEDTSSDSSASATSTATDSAATSTSVQSSGGQGGEPSTSASGLGGAGGLGGGDGEGGGGGKGGGGGGGGGGGEPCSPDLLEDPLHCGYCGHDCLGGDCVEGACRPIALNQPLPKGIYLHLLVDAGEDGSIFFTRWRWTGNIYRLRKTPQIAPDSMGAPAGAGWAGGLAKNAEAIFYSNYSNADSSSVRGVHRLPRNGDPSTQLVFDDAAQTYLGTVLLAVEDGDLYFSTQYGGIALGRTTVNGGAVTPLWDLESPAPNGEGGYGLKVVDGWGYVGSGVNGVLRFSRDGEKQIVFDGAEAGVGFAYVHDVAVGFVYWGDADGTLRRGNADGSGEVEVLAANVGRQAAVHDGWIYVITADQTAIDRIPVDDPQAPAERLVFAPALNQIANIAFDEVSLYWMGIDHGEVFRLAL